MSAVDAGEIARLVSISPARVAALLNALSRGPLADARLEDAMHDALGRAELDIVTLTGEGVFIGDRVAACEVALCERDAWALADVAEQLLSRALGRACRDEQPPPGDAAVAEHAQALLDALAAALRWGALVDVAIEDGEAPSYRACAVSVGRGLEGARRALAARVDERSALFARLIAGLLSLGSCPRRIELASVSRLQGGRVVTLRLQLGRIDRESEELIDACRDDVASQAEVFASVVQLLPAQRRPWPARSASASGAATTDLAMCPVTPASAPPRTARSSAARERVDAT